MRKRDEYLAGFFEKISVGLLVAAFVRDNTAGSRAVFVILAVVAIVIGYLMTLEDD